MPFFCLLDRLTHCYCYLLRRIPLCTIQTVFFRGKKFFPQFQHFFTAGKGFDIHHHKISFAVFG